MRRIAQKTSIRAILPQLLFGAALLLLGASQVTGQFFWPTPLPVAADTPWEDIVQPAASGIPATGLYGIARNDGGRFHEGLDIRPHKRDKRGEPTDIVRAVTAGIVVHVVPEPNGPYGRYVVLTHTEPGLRYYTLYAHLRSTDPAIKPGLAIPAGQTLGIMGRSDASRGFAKERAHTHFEVGLRLSDQFDTWYSRQFRLKKVSYPNRHGNWNGVNLYGVDPLPYLQDGLKKNATPALLPLLRAEPTALTVNINTRRIPFFVRENPALLTAPLPPAVQGWRIEIAWHGLPVRWTPLATPPVAGAADEKVFNFEVTQDPEIRRKARIRKLFSQQKRGPVADDALINILGIIFP